MNLLRANCPITNPTRHFDNLSLCHQPTVLMVSLVVSFSNLWLHFIAFFRVWKCPMSHFFITTLRESGPGDVLHNFPAASPSFPEFNPTITTHPTTTSQCARRFYLFFSSNGPSFPNPLSPLLLSFSPLSWLARFSFSSRLVKKWNDSKCGVVHVSFHTVLVYTSSSISLLPPPTSSEFFLANVRESERK